MTTHKPRLTVAETNALLSLYASDRPVWVITMSDDFLRMCQRLRNKELVGFVQRPPDRRGNLMGADAVLTPAGRARAQEEHEIEQRRRSAMHKKR